MGSGVDGKGNTGRGSSDFAVTYQPNFGFLLSDIGLFFISDAHENHLYLSHRLEIRELSPTDSILYYII